MKKSWFRLVLSLAIFAAIQIPALPAFAAEMDMSTDWGTYGFSNVTHFASDGTNSWADSDDLVTFPYATGGTSSAGNSYSMGWVDLAPTYFDINFDMATDHPAGSESSSSGEIYLFVDEPVSYSFSGNISFFDSYGTSDIEFFVQLSDADSGQILFESLQISDNIDIGDLILGQQAGTTSNSLLGSMTGQLDPSAVYKLSYMTRMTRNSSTLPTTGDLFGSLDLTVTAVPEPGTGVLLAMGLAGVAIRGRRSRS